MRKILSFILAGFISEAVLLAADDYVVTIEEGNDVVWSDASADGRSGLLADGVKDRRLVKKGKGRLIIECDLKKPGYAGEI